MTKFKMTQKRFIKFLAVAVALFPFVSSAQFNGLGGASPSTFSSELNVSMIPTYPAPHGNVSMNIALYTGDLKSAKISWYKNDKLVLNGKGETKYSFKAGGAGEITKIEIGVELATGETFSKIFSINPAGVDLVWEADSYVPPFYQGKALSPKQGVVKIVAMPDFMKYGSRVSAKNLVYEWSNATQAYESQSGYGKNVLVINGSALGREDQIRVLVRDPSDNLVAQSSVTITPVDPEIVFYLNSAYYGNIFDTAMANPFDMGKSDEVEAFAAPYYFSRDGLSGLKYSWRLNGESIPGLENSMTAVFRRPEEGSGESSISLNIENLKRVLQGADGSLSIKFNNG